MDIQKWFDNNGSYAEGLELYQMLPTFSNVQFKSLRIENFSNFIRLKYELKRGLTLGYNVSTIPNEIPVIPEIPENSDLEEEKKKAILEASKKESFAKETMAMYPPELHPVYRQRISDFYLACELKFKLNALEPKDEKTALEIILQIEPLWEKIDRAWMVLEYWKDNSRIMPTEATIDYSKFTPQKLWKEKALIETRISKRKKTLNNLEKTLEADPENRLTANQYKKRKEVLEQLRVDLEIIKNLLK